MGNRCHQDVRYSGIFGVLLPQGYVESQIGLYRLRLRCHAEALGHDGIGGPLRRWKAFAHLRWTTLTFTSSSTVTYSFPALLLADRTALHVGCSLHCFVSRLIALCKCTFPGLHNWGQPPQDLQAAVQFLSSHLM